MLMRYLLVTLFIGISVLSAKAQQYEVVKDRTGKNLLKGFVTDSILRADTINYKWFGEHQAAYTPPETVVKAFADTKDNVSFLIFFGTWCADSHYVIPRFYKILEQVGFDKNRLTVFALDRTKKDNAHFATNMNIAHVPTIIILKDGKELGRVVEYGPSGKFDEELATILKKAM